MSIVEKAMARLRALQSAQAASAPVQTPAQASATSIERSQLQPACVREPAPGATRIRIDRVALEHAGVLASEGAASARLVNEMRRIKRPLLENISGKGSRATPHARRIVVTSAMPGEGKTFTSINLAMSLAHERDFEVLLVDGDIPKSDVTLAFGQDGKPGLMDVLVDERCRPADAIVRTDLPNLLVLPVGTRNPLASELLGSLRMDDVLDQLGTQNPRRLLIFDSPPLLMTPEAQVLASRMGQVVVVVAAGRTTRQELGAAMQLLGASQYVGLVLNKSRLQGSASYYYGYYGRTAADHEADA
jgi:exopolysaccharide/PEP-CTERM locus tyrosine autokinase